MAGASPAMTIKGEVDSGDDDPAPHLVVLAAGHRPRLEIALKLGYDAGLSLRSSPLRKTLVLAIAAAAMLTAACNTISGAGRDVSAAGRAVSGAADDAKR